MLNTAFLIIVLFYVYPLKFLCRMLTLYPLSRLLDQSELAIELSPMYASSRDTAILMIIYGVGVASIFFVLVLMYRHALKKSALLELSQIEEYDTRVRINMNVLMAAVPILSVILAFLLIDNRYIGYISGFTYWLYVPVMFSYGFYSARQRKKLLVEMEKAT